MHIRLALMLSFVALLAAVAGCGGEVPTATPTAPPGTDLRQVALDSPFVLSAGEPVEVVNAFHLFKIQGVAQDSRCPSDAQCIRAGDATLVLRIIEADGSDSTKTPTIPARGSHTVAHGGYTIMISNLLPHPISTDPIASHEYTAEFLVTADTMDWFLPADSGQDLSNVREALIVKQVFQLELAQTPAERAFGLMDREHVPEGAGMLFIFEQDGHHTLWMKRTLIPLDVLFLDSAGRIVDIQTMKPELGVPDYELTRYSSNAPARFAIEMNAGVATSMGLQNGELILFR